MPARNSAQFWRNSAQFLTPEPPSSQVPARNYTVESIVGPKQITPGGCANQAGGKLRGGPLITDRWSTWMEAYYGSRDDIGAPRGSRR